MERLIRADRPGIALLVVMLLTMVVAAIAASAALIGANSYLINQYDQRVSLLESAADAGLEKVRARLNGDPSLFPVQGFATLETDVAVMDAFGKAYAGVTRSTYAGPVGGGPGEYGTYGAIISVARDGDGAEVIRRLDLIQESFAVYAYFTDYEPTLIAFGNNDQLYGPVHSNSNIKIRSSGATFHDVVTTAGAFEGAGYATFKSDTTSGVSRILMPSSAQLQQLQARAAPGHLAITATSGGGAAQSRTRIHFVSKDVDNDGVEEGFVRIYDSPDEAWVTGNLGSSWSATRNCGHYEEDGRFNKVEEDGNLGHSTNFIMNSATARCFLGGADELNAVPGEPKVFVDVDSRGQWRAYPGTVHADVADEPHGEGYYLFPLDRTLNPGFRGVIYVDGKVVVSGTVRGRVTLAATGNIIIGDDLTYQNDPGGGTCEDILGLFSGGTIFIADNLLNAPRQAPNTGDWRTYDDSSDEFIHATLLSLVEIAVQNWGSGSTSAEPCDGVSWGRGCLYITGGLIQQTRGAVGTGAGHGYMKRYTHDTCTFSAAPPYFPSTGHFWRGRYYEIDPTGFDVAAYFQALN